MNHMVEHDPRAHKYHEMAGTSGEADGFRGRRV